MAKKNVTKLVQEQCRPDFNTWTCHTGRILLASLKLNTFSFNKLTSTFIKDSYAKARKALTYAELSNEVPESLTTDPGDLGIGKRQRKENKRYPTCGINEVSDDEGSEDNPPAKNQKESGTDSSTSANQVNRSRTIPVPVFSKPTNIDENHSLNVVLGTVFAKKSDPPPILTRAENVGNIKNRQRNAAGTIENSNSSNDEEEQENLFRYRNSAPVATSPQPVIAHKSTSIPTQQCNTISTKSFVPPIKSLVNPPTKASFALNPNGHPASMSFKR